MTGATIATVVSILAFACGAGCVALGLWSAALAPLRKKLATTSAALSESEERRAVDRESLVTARADAAIAAARIEMLVTNGAETVRNLERSLTRAGDVERELAGALATIEQMKLGERDVEARLQRVASSYVSEAREVLVRAAAERFAGDAGVFRERLAASVGPLNERLDVLGKSLCELGSARTQDQERVATLLEGLSAKMAGIDDATRRVERVLGNSQARGSWGEFELTRLLELTGMTEHISFETQDSGYGVDGVGRPDVVLRIPGNLKVPIDAKVPFARYQEAVSASTEAEREPLLDQAVAAVRGHVKVLAARKYHAGPACIGWTIMFVPIEAMLATLFARDHEIFEVARTARVLIASPLTLMLYLEAFSRGWAAQKQSENAAIILEEARTLVTRLSTFTEKLGGVGTHLNKAIDKYNEAVVSYESRLGPHARKILTLRGDTDAPVALHDGIVRARAIDEARLPATAPAVRTQRSAAASIDGA